MDPKDKTKGGKDPGHDPLQRKWLRLGEIIDLARGATDWPLPGPPSPWKGRFKDLKAAVEYRELQVAQPLILPDKRTPVSLENLWAFAVGQDALWDWLRDFCQRWRAARGIVLEDPAPKEASNPETAIRPNRRGRKKGSGTYDSKDVPLVEEIHALVDNEKPMVLWNAALSVADRAPGKTITSRAKRLVIKYKVKHGLR